MSKGRSTGKTRNSQLPTFKKITSSVHACFMRVLVVHRQSLVADQIKEHLPQCVVSCTDCGWTGLAKVRSNVFDLVISSYDLPVITGFEMVRSLRLFSQNPSIPVIMLEDGNESSAYKLLASQLQVSLMKLTDVRRMKYVELWLN